MGVKKVIEHYDCALVFFFGKETGFQALVIGSVVVVVTAAAAVLSFLLAFESSILLSCLATLFFRQCFTHMYRSTSIPKAQV